MPSVRYFTAKDQNRLKVKGLVKISHANNQKKVRVAILISEKIDFKFFEKVIRDKEGHYIRENICNQSNWQKINLQNIQAAHVAQSKKKKWTGTSLVVQWVRLQAPGAKGLGFIPGQRTRSHMLQLKILYASTKTQHSQIYNFF